MLTKNDCLSILVSLEDRGVLIDTMLYKLVQATEPPIEVLKFIIENRGMSINSFYENLRKKHNQHKSALYTNIVKEVLADEEILTVLTSLLVQISLYGKNVSQPEQFYKEARAEEITIALQNYFATGDLQKCKTLLHLIRADLLVLEYLAGRRQLQNN